eukprot:1101295-Prorocentrum_minimum.AAC.3
MHQRRGSVHHSGSYLRGVWEAAVGVLPVDADVLLVHANGVRDGQRLAPRGAQVPIKVPGQGTKKDAIN